MLTMTGTLGLAATLMLGLLAADAAAQSEPALKPSELTGGYTIVSGEKFGIKEPEERIEGATVRFSDDRIIVVDKEKKEIYGATYKLEACEGDHTCKITMTSKLADKEDQVAKGLIKKEGDTIKLIYALPGAAAPTEFKTGEKQLMFVMKNMNK
ncbi:hypothetical protein OJF2_34360 [Aquisphaera giovannonii]|uniref:Lipocalin-like domain-containing protein n=1 Tax=Aquisphaera giovannonii TaxID=406548 RepID=A0A5B9W4A5_9BACT|nr:hypothetical protein [Aquisphaera giovannonii]QEH34891.1 hypothetical protein OJF2_34360 [Aquisphaera giovannonii]